MRFITLPNLPEGDVALAAVSRTYVSVIKSLQSIGIETLEISPCERLPEAVSSHADMLIHPLGKEKIVVARGEAGLRRKLEQYGFQTQFSDHTITSEYPGDVPLNAARVGNFLLCLESALDQSIQAHCAEDGIIIVPVRQGYAKCATVIVDRQSIITADPSIAKAANAAGIKVLCIRPGFVRLAGFPYGFLGGSCGMIGNKKLAFTGNIKRHPDYEQIQNFCADRGVTMISLVDGPLVDVGGILPLKQQEEEVN